MEEERALVDYFLKEGSKEESQDNYDLLFKDIKDILKGTVVEWGKNSDSWKLLKLFEFPQITE